MRANTSGRAIILIFAHKPQIEWFEEIGLLQCFKILGRHPIRLVCPEGLDVRAYQSLVPSIEFDFIPAHWLSSLRSYNRLKILPFLYERYSGYEYMLTHELDAFVFRDELEFWCDQGWDYIGAPWFDGHGNSTLSARPIPGVNSGFSLRRIATMMRTLKSWKLIRPVGEVFREWQRDSNRSLRAFWWLIRGVTFRNCFHHRVNGFTDNEDMFWSSAGSRISGFRLANPAAAARFSFECNPERLFRENESKLPFGCHKWTEHEPSFWAPWIRAQGYQTRFSR